VKRKSGIQDMFLNRINRVLNKLKDGGVDADRVGRGTDMGGQSARNDYKIRERVNSDGFLDLVDEDEVRSDLERTRKTSEGSMAHS